MSAARLRVVMIALLVVAAVLGVVGHKRNSPWVVWVSYVCFFLAIAAYLGWRNKMRARVLDREEKTPNQD